MWIQLRRLLEMIRFSHTVFALPFALLAAAMAWAVPGQPSGSPIQRLAFVWNIARYGWGA